jgi:protein involved in polysaccharide export with SLBB domain
MSSLDSGSAETVPEYRLGFGDEVEVKFFNNEQFNEIIGVRPDGRITLERIGDIYVNGMTPSELDSLVTVTYADIIRDPDVTVFVRKFGSYQVYVLGEVKNPGGYPVERNMTIVQVLAVAGGVPFSGAMGSVMVLRQGRNEEIKAVKLDLNSYLAGGRLRMTTIEKEIEISANDFFILPQDIVYVPRTPVASIVEFLEELYRGVLPPLDIYLRALWWKGW